MLRTFLIGLILGGILTVGWWYTQRHTTGPVARAWNQAGEMVATESAQNLEATPEKVAIVGDSVRLSRQTGITRAVSVASPAVVGVNVVQVREQLVRRTPFFNDPFFSEFFPPEVIRQRVESIGSGFIISADGYILTCDHVVENATEILITLPGGKQEKAKLIGSDRVSDIALLKIDGSDFPFVKFCDTREPLVGEWAIAMGNPFGLFNNNVKPTVTVGVVSTIGQDFDRNREGRVYRDMIQTDAAINSGNSGGPLLNVLGDVIGMNTMIYTPVQNMQGVGPSAGVGFAVPAYRLREVVEAIKKGKTLNRDFYTGMSVQNIDILLMRSLGLSQPKGIVVSDVEKNSPSARAGILPGDVIIGLDEYEIIDVPSLRRALDRLDLKVGDTVNLKVLRDRKERSVKMKLEAFKR
ncbi:MAG: trypsin-like peptidase domain-containing protein [bacterium]|nr:trypsin-like peptidase domain-containing protein [bacterium]